MVKKGREITELIQVCYEIENSGAAQREIKALIEAKSELKVNTLTILTWDEEREMENDGMIIHIKPLWKWLTEETPAVGGG